ncbi:hypothetical protein BUALT_Bualt12G0036600 [Buddleja alternifolia]|uniref:TFIIS N-terminal domain-containing protein n=1 Tax=Buddleja alternifolia TaxID=168488 RepID=A0AAV6WZ05_9LAMI|nr:hypothetical protein BUALT_Bualt12G0036600 [Buddleja alternifolia]
MENSIEKWRAYFDSANTDIFDIIENTIEVATWIVQSQKIFGEVLRIKEILDNSEEQPEALLIESLRRLQLMAISVETLKFTKVGKSVNGLRKHGSKQVRDLVKTLLWNWKNMMDAWFDATQAIADAEVEPKSVETSIIENEEEERVPSTPLDERSNRIEMKKLY